MFRAYRSLPMSKTGSRDKDKEKHDYNPTRMPHTIMSPEELAAGKKSYWPELEITGVVRNLSPALWQLSHLRCLYLNDNCLTRLPPGISQLAGLTHLDLSCNKLRSLPAEMGDMVMLEQLHLNHNHLRVLPYELGRLFRLNTLGLTGNPLAPELFNLYNEQNGVSRLLTYLLDNLVDAERWKEAFIIGPDGQPGPQCDFIYADGARYSTLVSEVKLRGGTIEVGDDRLPFCPSGQKSDAKLFTDSPDYPLPPVYNIMAAVEFENIPHRSRVRSTAKAREPYTMSF
ncbi:hypothetical protein MRX96_032815 [Rhipicephalus microplus]